MNFTENALIQFKKLIDETGKPKSGIRFYTKQGCCSPSLQMSIEENPSQGDSVIKISDVDIFVTPDAEQMLAGITLDYTQEGFSSVKTTNESPAKKCC